MVAIKRIDHMAILVEDIESALQFWRDALGLTVAHVEDVPDQDSIVAFLPVGDSEIELVKPTGTATGVARFLKKRGPGFHHVCLEVDDIKDCIRQLSEKGIRLINPEPVLGTGGKRIAFIHPESAHGVLVELYELTQETSITSPPVIAMRSSGRSRKTACGVPAAAQITSCCKRALSM